MHVQVRYLGRSAGQRLNRPVDWRVVTSKGECANARHGYRQKRDYERFFQVAPSMRLNYRSKPDGAGPVYVPPATFLPRHIESSPAIPLPTGRAQPVLAPQIPAYGKAERRSSKWI